MKSGRLCLPSRDRLKTGREFDRVFRGGRRVSGKFLTVVYRSADESGAGRMAPGAQRAGFVTPKKLGKAHDRNKLRRWLREAYRKHRAELAKNFEMILLGKPAGIGAAYGEIESELCRLWRTAGLLKPGDS